MFNDPAIRFNDPADPADPAIRFNDQADPADPADPATRM